MAETLRELVVALSLDSSNFSRNMRTISQQMGSLFCLSALFISDALPFHHPPVEALYGRLYGRNARHS